MTVFAAPLFLLAILAWIAQDWLRHRPRQAQSDPAQADDRSEWPVDDFDWFDDTGEA